MNETQSKALPMSGVRVIDCGTFIAGPVCATLLGEFGADVIKVELPGVGCPLRRFGTVTSSGDSLPWFSESRNKRSLTLDLRTSEGAAILTQLVRQADVLVENFQPGTMERWNLGPDQLHAANPRLVYVRISAFGQTGPYRDRPGFGRIANAFGGISYLAGYPDRAPVTPGSATLADYLSGMFAALGAVFALRVTERVGQGQVVDLGLYESVFRILDELAPAYAYEGTIRERMGPGTVNAVPHSHYPTKDGRWIAIACTSDKMFERFATLAGAPELSGDGRWGIVAARIAARAAVDAFVTAWTSELSAEQVLHLCEQAQVPCGPIMPIDQIFSDPQYEARGNLRRIDDARIGSVTVPDVVPRLSITPGRIDHLGPALGAHTDAILSGLLGLDAEQIAALRAKGVV